jgi:MurNAc alpha-1-phosphate uridylyltransferase
MRDQPVSNQPVKKPIDTAMIMTAGLGTRMAPLTDTCPKPLLKVAGKTLADHVIDRLLAAGVKRIVANLHYKSELVRDHLSARKDVEILFSDETDALLETGGGIKKALPLLGDEPFLVANTDALWIDGLGSNLERITSTWDPEIMDSLVLCAATVNSVGGIGRGDFLMGGDGKLRRRKVAHMAPFMMAGVYVLSPHLFEGSPDGAFSTNLLWNKALEKERLYGLRLDGTWLHASAPKDLVAIERILGEL